MSHAACGLLSSYEVVVDSRAVNSLIMNAFCRYWRGSAQYPPMYQGWMNAAPQRSHLDQDLQPSQAVPNATCMLETHWRSSGAGSDSRLKRVKPPSSRTSRNISQAMV